MWLRLSRRRRATRRSARARNGFAATCASLVRTRRAIQNGDPSAMQIRSKVPTRALPGHKIARSFTIGDRPIGALAPFDATMVWLAFSSLPRQQRRDERLDPGALGIVEQLHVHGVFPHRPADPR